MREPFVRIPAGYFTIDGTVDRALYKTKEEALSASENIYKVFQEAFYSTASDTIF